MYFVARPSQAGGAEDNLLSHGKFVHRVCYFFVGFTVGFPTA
jgi:hypothetical protein